MTERELRIREADPVASAEESKLGGWGRWIARITSPLGVLIAIPGLVTFLGLALTVSNFYAMRELGRAEAWRTLAVRAEGAEANLRAAFQQADTLLDRVAILARAHSSEANIDSLALRLHDLALARSGLKWVSVSFPDGMFLGVFMDPNRRLRVQVSRRVGSGTEMHRYDVKGDALIPKERDDLHYDPRDREFYTRAVEQRTRLWTDPYPFFSDRGTGITRAEALFDDQGALHAVITADYNLAELSGLITDSSGDVRFVAFTPDGSLLALPRADLEGLAHAPQRVRPVRFSDLRDPALRQFFETRPSGAGALQREFQAGPRRFIAVERAISAATKLDWRLAAVIDEAVLLEMANRHTRASSIVGLSVMFGAVLLSSVLAVGVNRLRNARTRAEARTRSALAEAHDLGSYQLEEAIGSGGMGQVYRARHRMLRRPAAIKLIRTDLPGIDAADMESRFEREAFSLAQLRSPHTVSILDYGKAADGRLYLVMELLDGLPLDRAIQKFGPLPAARVIPILIGVCRSLSEAHAAGLVHRDIKPSNVFLCYDGDGVERSKVIDFGLAKQPRGPALTADGSVAGTIDYMAPEQARGEAIDARADLYSLGCLGFYLLTGKVVFEAVSDVAAVLARQTDPLPSLSKSTSAWIPIELEQIILRCLAREPGFRPRSASSVAKVLLKIPVPDSHGIDPDAMRTWWEEVHSRS